MPEPAAPAPEPAAPAPPAAPGQPAPPTPAPTEQPAPALTAAPEPKEAARSSSWFGAGIAFGVLNLPNFGVGATVLGQVRADEFWPIDLAAVYWFENHAELLPSELDLQLHPLVAVPFPPGGSQTSFTATEVRAALCPLEHRLRTGSLIACAGLQGGVLFARPEGFLDEQDQTRPLLGIEVYARWHYPIAGPIGLTYSAGAFVPLIRERFGYRDGFGKFRETFQIAPAGARLDVALTYSL
jgi:hypothetical protein